MIDEPRVEAEAPEGIHVLLTGEENGPTFEFWGTKLAAVSSREEYGDRSKRWREIALYRKHIVAGGRPGRYVVHSVGRTLMPNEIDRHNVLVFDSPEEVMAYLMPPKTKPRYIIVDLIDAVLEVEPGFANAVGDQFDVEDLDGPQGVGEIYELARESDRYLRFRGKLIAHSSSRAGDAAPSWTEVKIFQTRGYGGPRYVIWKARCFAGYPDEPRHANAHVVGAGYDALRSLIRPGETVLESAVFNALQAAARQVPHFNSTLHGLLENNQFLALLPETPALNKRHREALRSLAAGARIVTQQDENDYTTGVIGWDRPDGVPPKPTWPVFMSLSLKRLIRRVRGVRLAGDVSLLVEPNAGRNGEWEISDFGRATLDVDLRAVSAAAERRAARISETMSGDARNSSSLAAAGDILATRTTPSD